MFDKDKKASAIAEVEALIAKIQQPPKNAFIKIEANGGVIANNLFLNFRIKGNRPITDISATNNATVQGNQFNNFDVTENIPKDAEPILKELLKKIEEEEEPKKLNVYLQKLIALGEFGINLYNDLHKLGIA
jgi:hypothetical protein